MIEIKLTPQELKEAIEFGKLIGSGFYSSVFRYKGKLIKLDKELYKLLKVNDPSLSTDVIISHYRWSKEDFNGRDQIEELLKRQPFIRPRVPEGIVTLKEVDPKIDGISPGIIIPPFDGYKNLSKISKTEYKRILILLKKIFDDVKELADNEIAQEDIIGDRRSNNYNILQKDDDSQMIDMSGPYVTVGSTFTTPNEMYKELGRLINEYYIANGLEPPYKEGNNITEDDLSNMITEFDKQTKNKG